MVKIKEGASVFGLRPEVVLAIVVAQGVYGEVDCVVTSGTESDAGHGYGSLHYQGLAVDLRTGNLKDRQAAVNISEVLQSRLGREYDVVLESDHIHVEFQKKK